MKKLFYATLPQKANTKKEQKQKQNSISMSLP